MKRKQLQEGKSLWYSEEGLSGSTDPFEWYEDAFSQIPWWEAGIISLSSMQGGKHGTNTMDGSNPVSNLKAYLKMAAGLNITLKRLLNLEGALLFWKLFRIFISRTPLWVFQQSFHSHFFTGGALKWEEQMLKAPQVQSESCYAGVPILKRWQICLFQRQRTWPTHTSIFCWLIGSFKICSADVFG